MDGCRFLWLEFKARTEGYMRVWTEQEVTTLLSMWPTATYLQIGNALHRSRHSVCDKAKWLRDKGLLEGTKDRRNAMQSVKPDQQDFDAAKMDYCRNHQIDITQLNAGFASDNRLAAELFRLAQAATLSDGRAGVPRRGSGGGEYSS